jgi:sulfur relay (sulfurtransferase) DsrF/TusC family protein
LDLEDEKLVKSVVILCEDSPIGKNSNVEAVRMGAGITVMGDIEDCKIVFMGDAVHFLSKHLKPEAVNMDDNSNIYRMMELSDITIFALDSALETAGLDPSDIIDFENVKIVNAKDVAQMLLEADITYRY